MDTHGIEIVQKFDEIVNIKWNGASVTDPIFTLSSGYITDKNWKIEIIAGKKNTCKHKNKLLIKFGKCLAQDTCQNACNGILDLLQCVIIFAFVIDAETCSTDASYLDTIRYVIIPISHLSQRTTVMTMIVIIIIIKI